MFVVEFRGEFAVIRLVNADVPSFFGGIRHGVGGIGRRAGGVGRREGAGVNGRVIVV